MDASGARGLYSIMITRCLVRLCVLSLLAFPACDDSPVDPGDDSEPYSYPLKLGTTAFHERSRLIRYYSLDGTRQVRPPIDLQAVSERTLIGVEEIAGNTYVVEREWFYAEETDTVTSWRRMRQRNGGLYRADVPTSVSPGSVPPLDSIAEARLLAYPLALDAQWAQFPGGSTSRRVEAIDAIDGDVVWRIRVTAARDGPQDVHREWYGLRGLVRRLDHVEVVAVDGSNGEPILIVSDDLMEMRDQPSQRFRSALRDRHDMHRDGKLDGAVGAREKRERFLRFSHECVRF